MPTISSRWDSSTWSIPGACCTTPARCGPRWPMPRRWSRPVESCSSPFTTTRELPAGAGRRSRSSTTKLPRGLRFLVVWPSFWVLYWRRLVKDFLRGRPFQTIRDYGKNQRGMSFWQDLIDWVGGYPFEVAKPEQIFDFYRERGFTSDAAVDLRRQLGLQRICVSRRSARSRGADR